MIRATTDNKPFTIHTQKARPGVGCTELLDACETALFVLCCIEAETNTCTCAMSAGVHGSGCLSHHVEAAIRDLHVVIDPHRASNASHEPAREKGLHT